MSGFKLVAPVVACLFVPALSERASPLRVEGPAHVSVQSGNDTARA